MPEGGPLDARAELAAPASPRMLRIGLRREAKGGGGRLGVIAGTPWTRRPMLPWSPISARRRCSCGAAVGVGMAREASSLVTDPGTSVKGSGSCLRALCRVGTDNPGVLRLALGLRYATMDAGEVAREDVHRHTSLSIPHTLQILRGGPILDANRRPPCPPCSRERRSLLVRLCRRKSEASVASCSDVTGGASWQACPRAPEKSILPHRLQAVISTPSFSQSSFTAAGSARVRAQWPTAVAWWRVMVLRGIVFLHNGQITCLLLLRRRVLLGSALVSLCPSERSTSSPSLPEASRSSSRSESLLSADEVVILFDDLRRLLPLPLGFPLGTSPVPAPP
jgi:hypothetical protein